MFDIDALCDDFVAADMTSYNLSICIFFFLGTDKLVVLRPYISTTDLARMSPEQQIGAAMRAGASRKIVSQLFGIGEILSAAGGHLVTGIDGEFLMSSTSGLIDMVQPIDDVVLKALDYLALIQHPTNVLSQSGKRRAVENDINSIVERRAEFVDVYSGAEMAFILAHVNILKSFENMASALGYFNKLQSRGVIDNCKVRSCQHGTVRWSIACRVLVGDKWSSVVTPYCVSLQMARLMIMSCCFIAPGEIRKKAKIPLAKIYDRDRFHRIYRKSKKLLVDDYEIDLENKVVRKRNGPPDGESIGVDLGAVVAFSLKHSIGVANPMQLLSSSFSSRLLPADLSTMIGSSYPDPLMRLNSLDATQALLVLSSTRHQFQDMRFNWNMTDLNKAACLGVSSSLYQVGVSGSSRTLRATVNLLETISDIMNCCGGFMQDRDKLLHIVWYSAIDMNPVIALCTLLRVNFIIQVGDADLLFFKGNRDVNHRTYDKIEGVMEGIMPDDDSFFSHQASVLSSYTMNCRPILVCGGLSGSGMEKGASATFAMSVFFGLMAHIGAGGEIPEFVYCDFVLPDACPHFVATYNDVCEGELPTPDKTGCEDCALMTTISEDFGRLKEEDGTYLSKPRVAFAHNRHLALTFDPNVSREQGDMMTLKTVAGVVVADVWRCARDDNSGVIVPQRKVKGGGYIDDPNATCEVNKMAESRQARDAVYSAKGASETAKFCSSLLSSVSIFNGSDGSGQYENFDMMDVRSDVDYDSD